MNNVAHANFSFFFLEKAVLFFKRVFQADK